MIAALRWVEDMAGEDGQHMDVMEDTYMQYARRLRKHASPVDGCHSKQAYAWLNDDVGRNQAFRRAAMIRVI